VLLDRDESALHGAQLSMEGRALLDTPALVVADIRDRPRVHEIFARWQPEVVFHAAALKHLPLLELHPEEAIKTNDIATQHVLDAAIAHGVERFVNVSTDKAADPISILGYTKRISERLTAAAALRTRGTFLSVRFGNVLGSRGSVLTSFQAQAAAGGPITVTHPDVTRFFMTVEEAVQLLIQAGGIGRNGEALVLDMGSPVRILDVARQIAAAAPTPVSIEFTGLRFGEKLHEVLWGVDEEDARPIHPLVSHVQVPPLDPADLEPLHEAGGRAVTRLALVALCGMDEADVFGPPAPRRQAISPPRPAS
jgi:FlaA1/EpsC-like NDP-sugar epimerase